MPLKTRKTETKLLRCEVHKGMFSDEATVTVRDISGEEHSFWVPKTTVQGDRVKVRARKEADGCVVTLPTPEPNSVVFVKAEDVS